MPAKGVWFDRWTTLRESNDDSRGLDFGQALRVFDMLDRQSAFGSETMSASAYDSLLQAYGEPDKRAYACKSCCDTRRVPIIDDDDTTEDEPVHFTGCWDCNERDDADWDDSRCPDCGGPFEYPVCITRHCSGL